MSMDGKRIVLLGGSSGVGLATAQAAARDGASVVIASRRKARVDQALTALPVGAEGHVLDLTDAAAIQELFARLGRFDHLVFTAGGILQLGSLANTDVEEARRAFELRYWGAYFAAKYGSVSIRPGGSIVFTSGLGGRRPPGPGWTLVASVAAAVEGLARALALELAPIRVNVVAPGLVKTPLWAGMSDVDRETLYRNRAEKLPVRHIGEPQEIAEAYLYLMRQSYGTGQVLVVDGGAMLV
jgi:NAD(P)-dependent dehydrogenase (short-subunit alcohol dehydrogenase family)